MGERQITGRLLTPAAAGLSLGLPTESERQPV
jgi:hypothetical protein